MDTALCKMTLVYPHGIEDRIVEVVLATEPSTGGFSTWQAEGHGQDFVDATTSERVRGRVRRSMLVAVMPLPRARELLDRIEREMPARHLAYWLEPVLEFGRIAPRAGGAKTGRLQNCEAVDATREGVTCSGPL